MSRTSLLLLPTLLALAAPAQAAENPRAARSVHLAYEAPAAIRFYTEMTIEESVPGSYFMAAGFDRGYFGLQELGGGRKIALFSVWDPTRGDNPNAVAEDQRVQVLSHGSNVTVRRFGGEGTGGQSLRSFDWERGRPYRFLVTAWTDAQTTTYRGQLYDPVTSNWLEMATFRTLTGGRPLHGLHAFVEDFRRDGRSVQERRSARYGNGWAERVDGGWTPITKAAFSADGNVHTNIDANAAGDRFQLATGGATTMSRALWSRMQATAAAAPPADLAPREAVPQPAP